jgi:hypothetical protein
MGTLAIWYAHLSEDELMNTVRRTAAKVSKSEKEAKRHEQRAQKVSEKAHTRDSLQALSKLGEVVDGKYPDRQPAADRGPGAGPGSRLRPVSRPG